MDKKPSSWHGLHSGMPRLYKTEAQVRAQWESGPKLLGPSLAARLVERGKAKQAEKPSEKKPAG